MKYLADCYSAWSLTKRRLAGVPAEKIGRASLRKIAFGVGNFD